MAVIRRQKLSEQVCKKLRKLIDNRAAGFKLPSENELTKLFSVSRSTIREAISTLIAENLLIAHQGKGLFVVGSGHKPILTLRDQLENIKELSEAYSIVKALESENLAEIASTISLEQKEKLDKNLNKFVKCSEQEVDSEERLKKLAEIDSEFHHLLASFSQNIFLFSFLEYLFDRLRDSRKYFLGSAEKEQRMIWEHRRIVEALYDGTGIAAKALIEGHIASSLEYLNQEIGNFS